MHSEVDLDLQDLQRYGVLVVHQRRSQCFKVCHIFGANGAVDLYCQGFGSFRSKQKEQNLLDFIKLGVVEEYLPALTESSQSLETFAVVSRSEDRDLHIYESRSLEIDFNQIGPAGSENPNEFAAARSWISYGRLSLVMCDVMPFKTNSRTRFAAASAPMSAKPFNRTSEAPRSDSG